MRFCHHTTLACLLRASSERSAALCTLSCCVSCNNRSSFHWHPHHVHLHTHTNTTGTTPMASIIIISAQHCSSAVVAVSFGYIVETLLDMRRCIYMYVYAFASRPFCDALPQTHTHTPTHHVVFVSGCIKMTSVFTISNFHSDQICQ